MSLKDPLISTLSSYLFWDVNPEDLDHNFNKDEIVSRVMSRGLYSDFQTIRKFYGDKNLLEILLQLRDMDVKTLHYCSTIFSTPITNFRCYAQNASRREHWDF